MPLPAHSLPLMVNPTSSSLEPSINLTEPAELLGAYLDVYRDTVLRKLAGLRDEQLRCSELPSGWSPLGLLKHLLYMERRWLRWGFAAECVPDPWGERLPGDTGWLLTEDDSLEELRSRLAEQRDHTRAIISGAELGDRARVGGRFKTAEQCPTLGWTLCHVLQEYARHAGHLDIARELLDGVTGE